MPIKLKKLCTAALAVIFATTTAHATTNLLQAVTVAIDFYSQGTTITNASGTNYNVNKGGLGVKDLIKMLSPSNVYDKGDILARATPITNEVVNGTNLTVVSTTNLILTNTSTSLESISNEVIFAGLTNDIGGSNLVFSSSLEVIDGTNVTTGTNTAMVEMGGNVNPLSFVIGTNTTVTTTTLTNAVGEITGTNYAFAINALTSVPSGTNTLGPPSWVIYNPKWSPPITPISTNVYFDIHRAHVYHDTNNLAYVHGETVGHNHVIHFGTTDEIRVLVFSNASWQIRMQGYAAGRYIPVSLGGNDVVYTQDYGWIGNGSGVSSNATDVVLQGDIGEAYFKFLQR